MSEIVQWVLDFVGVHNGENRFSTQMYNFWSGFGGNVSLLAVSGTIVGVYRHNLRRLGHLVPIRRRRTGGGAEH